MRLLFSVLVALICFCVPVKAQEKTNQNAAEGAGLLVSDVNGALPKGLWRNNPRSEITYLLKTLPAEAPFKSLQKIKRNMLLSTYDTSDIDNDVEIAVGDDFFTLRMAKLMELGLWDDAYKLYTKTTNDPGQNGKLAEIGVLLSLYKQGIPNACLENKAFGPRYTGDFWDQMELICGTELYDETIISTQFANSSILNAIYTQPNFTINANALNNLTFLELMMALKKSKIDYVNFELSRDTPPHIIKTFLSDNRFPTTQKAALESLAKAKVVIVDDSSENENNPSDVNFDNQLTNSMQNEANYSWFSEIITAVENNQKIDRELTQKLLVSTGSKPQNIVYYQLLKDFNLVEDLKTFSPDKIAQANKMFSTDYTKELKILNSWLDNSPEFSNNPVKVYEKQINMPLGEEFAPYSKDWTEWLGKTTSHQLAGLSLLIVLNNDKNIGVRSDQLLNDLRHVGLIEQSHQVARDMTARLMRITN